MTEDVKNGLVNGSNEQVGGNGDEQKASENETANNTNVDELAKLQAELSKKDATISKFAEEKKQREQEAEQARLANLSTEEQLKEVKAQLKADKEERALINAATSKGLNPTQARELAQKVKDGDFEAMATLMAAMLDDAKTSTAQQVEEVIKSSIQTSTAPNVKTDNNSPFMTAMRQSAGLK